MRNPAAAATKLMELAPRQRRSLESHERLVQAAERLMATTGSSQFTLADVCRESGLSVGGIYRRFEDKDALIRAVQQRLNARMEQEFTQFEATILADGSGLEQQLSLLVTGLTDLLKRHAPSIKAMVEASWTDPVVAKHGFEAYEAHSKRFKTLLLRHRRRIAVRDPEHAAEFCFSCIYELVVSHLGIGRQASEVNRSWPRLVEDLQRLCIAYLAGSGTREQERRP
jgi:AcrR family transcriptional regulator